MNRGFFDAQTAGAPADDVQTAQPEPEALPAAHHQRALRDAALELMRSGVVEAARKPQAFRSLLSGRSEVVAILSPLALRMGVDELRGLAWLAVDAEASGADDGSEDADTWSHPLVRRQRLNLEQSLLVAILRQQFVAHEMEAGVGAGEAVVALEDLLPHLQAYLGELGSDAQEKKRLLSLLEQLKGHGLVSDVDAQERVSIRPLIAHLANPENLQNLLQALRESGSSTSSDSAGDALE